MQQLGVEHLDFYIATHSHSDHIGSGDEILDHFPTDCLYIGRYDDSYMLGAHGTDPNDPYYYPEAKESYLWDNQYVYDNLMYAAKRNGVQIITDLDLDENAEYRNFQMGDMNISIMNYERERDEEGNIIPVASENDNSLVVKIEAFGKNTLLTSDIDPTNGDTGKIADQLIKELWDTAGVDSERESQIVNEDYDMPYTVDEDNGEIVLDMPENQDAQVTIRDESEPNYGRKISLDLMKMAHHSVDGNNTTYFLTSLNPKTVVITGSLSWYNDRMKKCLPKASVYATISDSAAIVAEFSEDDGLTTEYVKVNPEWNKIDGQAYYFDENGRPVTGWRYLDNKWYYFDYQGIMQTGWQYVADRWYYLNSSGAMLNNGWNWINGRCYYLNANGMMASNTWIDAYYVDATGAWVPDKKKIPEQWMYTSGRWWYRHEDGSYSTSNWEYIGGHWYWFDADGYMATGWRYVNGYWYYMDANGSMAIGWRYVNNCWYYMNNSGVMQNGWLNMGNVVYYLNIDGSMQIGWKLLDNAWYYFKLSGEMSKECWIQGIYYVKNDGRMATSEWVDNERYYVDENGVWILNYEK